MRKVVLYIVYGCQQSYYDGAKFSFLTFMHWIKDEDAIEIVILTEKPEEFSNYPVKVLSISEKQINEWSLDDKYHFRIKNRGLAYSMDKLKLKEQDKILFFDADTYFHKSPLKLFDLIQRNQALFYLNEGLIYKKKRFHVFIQHLEGNSIEIDKHYYKLSKQSAMWGALIVGIMAEMRVNLELADKLMLKLIDMVPVHTVEQFALSEIFSIKYKIVEGKDFVSSYSSSGKMKYAKVVLSRFFKQHEALTLSEKIYLAQKIRIKRLPLTIIKQRILKLFNN